MFGASFKQSKSGILVVAMVLGGGFEVSLAQPLGSMGLPHISPKRQVQLLRCSFSGQDAAKAVMPVNQVERDFIEMSGRMGLRVNRQAHRVIQESRRAGLREFRRQVRLLTPKAMDKAREAASNWQDDQDPLFLAESAAVQVYARGEAAAREAAIEASQTLWADGYQRIKAEGRKIAREYRGRLEVEARLAARKAMFAKYKKGCRNRVVRDLRAFYKTLKKYRSRIAHKVALKVRKQQQGAYARLQKDADARGFAVYQQGEEAAYAKAQDSIEADRVSAVLRAVQPTDQEIEEALENSRSVSSGSLHAALKDSYWEGMEDGILGSM
jgi:hypothetical protein